MHASFTCHLEYANYQRLSLDKRVQHQSARESAIYEKLEKGPNFQNDIPAAIQIQRESLVQDVRTLVTPTENSRFYRLIVGEPGTGKTSLIQLAVDGVNKDGPKGIAYVGMPDECDTETKVVKAMQQALGWSFFRCCFQVQGET